jgi:hypothetical protein
MGNAADHPALPGIPLGPFHQSGAASAVLTAIFGEDFAFDDADA